MGRKSSMSKLTFTESHFTRHRCCRHRLHHYCRHYHHQHHRHHYYHHCHYHYRYRSHNFFFYYHCTGICRKCRESFESKSQIDELTLAIKDLRVSNLEMAPSKPIQKNIIDTLNKWWILQHSFPLKNCSNQNVWCNSSTPQAIFDSKIFHSLSSWGNNNRDRATMNRTPFSLEQLSTIFTARVTRLL